MPTHKQIAEAYYKRETELRAGNGLDETICREAMRLAAGDLELPMAEIVATMRAEFTKKTRMAWDDLNKAAFSPFRR